MYHQRRSFQDRKRKVRTTGFLALQFTVKCLKAPTLRVSLRRGCILTQIQTIGSEIITDVTIRMPGKAGTMMMEVKVDPGAQPSCIPLHKFKTLFPHLCRDGLPKGGLVRQHPQRVPVLQRWRHDMLWAPANRCQRQGHQEVSSH